MIIKKMIDGVEREIELTREEMTDIACELDLLETTDGVENYIEELVIEDYDESVQNGIMKFMSFTDEQKQLFYRDCAEGILDEVDHLDLSFSDDLTDIYEDIIISSFENINEFIEREEIEID